MDYQNRVGSKKGSGGVAGTSEANANRRERLRKLAQESINIDKDPYVFRNHLGHLECKLCLTSHLSDGGYLAHTQGKKHQLNLERRAQMQAKETKIDPVTGLPIPDADGGQKSVGLSSIKKRKFRKIGRPGYKISKIRDPVTRRYGLLFEVKYPEAQTQIQATGNYALKPRYRIMSAMEQTVDKDPDLSYQYLVVAAEPYESVAFRLPASVVDKNDSNTWSWWDADSRQFYVQLMFTHLNISRY